jgi:DNA-binding MarR family transcriptional regulator
MMRDDIKRQKDIDKVAKLTSDNLLKSWLIIDGMLPKELRPIRDGLKRRRTRSSQGTRLATNFLMFMCTAGILHRDGNLTMGELSRATSIPQSTATRMVDWMVDNGYVDRFEDAEDRRLVRMSLTDSGLELLLAAKSQLRELVARIFERLPAIQRAAFLYMLADLMSAWQSVSEEQITAAQSEEQMVSPAPENKA